ncbi:kinase-like domain-containing protein [Rhizophagus irregularis DAOM 181602=DAOM 197198]|nr:kinase-like domain-containing protein [Rhizophagus irregularis DAOM 181602=DAOM 197198]
MHYILSYDIETYKFMNYIPYSQFTNVKELAEGGFSIVYQATWLDGPKYTSDIIAILKRFKNSQDTDKYFVNELKSNYHCYNYAALIKTYDGLREIHNANFIHRDIHSGNVLVSSLTDCKVGDLGLSRPTNDISPDNEIYGVIPYIAPEIFKGSKCVILIDQSFNKQFDQAELIREELIDSKKLGPEFSEKPHPKAIYTSRSLNSYISKCSSIFSKCSSISFTSNDYTSEELKLDIDIESGLN